jgi:hypothetical protein
MNNIDKETAADIQRQLSEYKAIVNGHENYINSENLAWTRPQQLIRQVNGMIGQMEAFLEGSGAGGYDNDGGGNSYDDPCSMLDQVYPSSNVTDKYDSKNEELRQYLYQQMIKLDGGYDLYKSKVHGKSIYFIEAANKKCFYHDHLANLYPCRFAAQKRNDHDLICLTSSAGNFTVLTVYGKQGNLIKNIIPKKQLFDDAIEERERDIKEVVKYFDDPIDFFVVEAYLVDEKGKRIASEQLDKPKLVKGRYQNLKETFNLKLRDPRPAYHYERSRRKNHILQRKTTLVLLGSNGETAKKEMTLVGMEKDVAFSFKHAYSETAKKITTSLDFDKIAVGRETLTYDPAITGKGQPTILYIGAGMPKGNYTIQLVNKDSQKSQSCTANKTTKNGVIAISLDLSGLDDLDWDKEAIRSAVKDGQETVKSNLVINIFTELLELFEDSDKRGYISDLEKLKHLTDQSKNIVDIAKDLLGTSIPFVKGVCGAINLIADNVRLMSKIEKRRAAYEERKAVVKEIKKAIKHLNSYNDTSLDEDTVQQTWNYYKGKTGGDATTSMIAFDIQETFGKLVNPK